MIRDISPFEYEPTHQPDPDSPVKFRLRPLDQRALHEVTASLNDRGVPRWDGILEASRFILGWSGIKSDGADLPFSRQALRSILDGGADTDWMVWLGQITGHLYSKALISDDDRKKSSSPST
jgi:hypothetical protein